MTTELTKAADNRALVEAMKAHVSRAAKGATDVEVQAFVLVCDRLGLDPIMGEVHAMRDRSGTLRPIPSIDGWAKVIRSQPDFRGMQFEEVRDGDGDLVAIDCTMHVEGWQVPCVVREYYSECRRNTPVWQQMPVRMLRHRAMIQAARIAFGLGLSDVADLGEIGDAPAAAATTPGAATPAAVPASRNAGTNQLNQLAAAMVAEAVEPLEE
jgi:phage recombination protein Bet